MIRGGRSYVSSAPAFSNDAKRLLVCTGNSVTIFSTATGLPVASLEGHTALVTTVIVVPAVSKAWSYCWTASVDGTIRYWDFLAPELMKTINISLPIFSMVIPSILRPHSEMDEKTCDLFAYLSVGDLKETQNQSKLHGQVRRCNLTKSRLDLRMIMAEMERPVVISVSPSGEFLGVHVKRKLLIWKVPSTESERTVMKKITLHHTKTVTVLAFHPTQRIVGAGDVSGRILIWRGVGNRTPPVAGQQTREISEINNEERPGVRGEDDADSCTTWHWHPSEVKALSFSSDGAYLYSGGKEGVIVVWQLDTGKKKFLPRIGSPILYFTASPDTSLSSVSCADNQIHLLKMPSMEILKSISGIKPPCFFPETYKGLHSGVAFDQNAGLIALCTENYFIQLYSLFADRQVFEVQVCERNHQPVDEITVVVTLAVLSLDGSMLCTAEVKLAEEGLGGLESLKFWELASQKEFNLTTIVYEPHRVAGISAIAFHPTRQMAVSASYGGDFKIWTCNNEIRHKDQMGPNYGWTCHAVGSYKKRPMTAATFSPDGSVLAVAAETVITLWDPIKNVLLTVIGETLTPIMTLAFVGKSEHLVSASLGSKPQLSVWSMSKLSLSWSYGLHVEAVATALDLSSFAVLALLPQSIKFSESYGTTFKGRNGVILLFNTADPAPVAAWLVKQATGGSLAFLQGDHSLREEGMLKEKPSQTLLAFVNGDHEYVLFDPYGNEAHELNLIQGDGLSEPKEAGDFGYASVYGELPAFAPNRNSTSSIPSVPSERPWESIFIGSSHNLPPLTKLCTTFLESLLEKRTMTVE